MTEAKKEVAEKEAVLAELHDRNKSLAEKRDGLASDRAKALRLLAGGDAGQRKTVNDLDSKIKSVEVDLEGVELLMTEAEQAVNQAKDALKQAQEAEKAEIEKYISQKEIEECHKIVNSIGDQIKRFTDTYIEACHLLSEIQVAIRRVGVSGVNNETVNDALFRLQPTLAAAIREGGWKPLPMRGIPVELQIMPLIKTASETTTSLILSDIETARRNVRRQKWMEEFQNQK